MLGLVKKKIAGTMVKQFFKNTAKRLNIMKENIDKQKYNDDDIKFVEAFIAAMTNLKDNIEEGYNKLRSPNLAHKKNEELDAIDGIIDKAQYIVDHYKEEHNILLDKNFKELVYILRHTKV